MTLLILAAGLGSRYGGLKQLDPMTDSGNFIIDFSIYDAIRAGFDRVVFLIKRENETAFRETIGSRVEKKIRVEYAFQDLDHLPEGLTPPEGRVKPWGTGHAVYCAADVIGNDPFAVINADDFYGADTFRHLAAHLSDPAILATPARHCMVGFQLGNTLTENGTVSRGECEVADGMLVKVTERTKIEKRETTAAYLTEQGDWKEIPFSTIVSMNCWGFTPALFEKLESGFRAFWQANAANLSKCEYYLPAAVQEQKDEGLCDVRVYPTASKWLGVTYPDDKPSVKAAIAELIAQGEYPKDLWA
ncbi:MAG: nucleotidyltransferase [Ruminococcaceae bacterium]|nr:nucleotidyltransferase [Oscillospiraceae bacterium]